MRRPDARAMAQLLAEQTQTAAGLILRLAWRQGLTREEIQRLTWNDVDFSAHQLRLPDRTIPLETETEDCLRRQAERPDPPTPFVVVSDRRRQQMPPESISRLARKTLDRAGLGGISLMDLRHDFIIRHLESHDWPYVARISGIAVPTLYAVFSDYLPEGRQKDSRPRREVDGFLMWKLLQAEGSSPVGLALWMGWKLGMQVREMTALTWDQVDLDRGLVRLPDRDLALGVTLVSLRGSSVDLLHLLFGSILAVDRDAALFVSGVASLTLLCIALCYRGLVSEAFDSAWLQVNHRRLPALLHGLFLALLVLNLVAGFQVLGTLMAVGVMMLPAVAARCWARTLPGILLLAAGMGALCAWLGLSLSWAISLPAGPAIVLTASALFFVSLFFGTRSRLLVGWRTLMG